MLKEHIPLFERLCAERDVIVVTGGAEGQIRKQIPLDPTGKFYMLSQQGNYAVGKNGEPLWHEQVTEAQEKAVKSIATKLTRAFAKERGIKIPDENDIFENRGSQFASSVLGFHAPNKDKYAADPDQSIRRKLLAQYIDEVAGLRKFGIEAMPAGTTTIDFILAGKNKGYNITRFIERENWKKEDCVYIGDALFEGGNDATVIGVIPTHAVKGPDDTFDFVKANLL